MKSRRFLVECIVICVLITAGTIAVYQQVGEFGFLSLDDFDFIGDNPHVSAGLTLDGVKWSFASFHEALWQPLVWLSYMAEVDIYGLDSGAFHLTNVWLHVLNSLLLFAFFAWTTGCPRRSGFVAAMFALHPLHVESVAWVAERKDVLSALFWMLTMPAYARYSRAPSVRRYLPVVLLFALGLMSKAMLVTLPLVLLLLDYWPLRKEEPTGNRGRPIQSAPNTQHPTPNTRHARSLILEKVPLFTLATASAVVTVFAQSSGGAVVAFQDLNFGQRLLNALLSCMLYIWKMVWPAGLAPYYPLDKDIPIWAGIAAGAGLVFVSVLAARARTKRYLAAGWVWYLVTLLPVVGLVQVGMQAMADRYTYIPLIGLFVIAGWGIADLAYALLPLPRRWTKAGLTSGAVLLAIICGMASFTQVGYWRDDITLLTRATDVTRDNVFAHFNLGAAYRARGEARRAAKHYAEALRIDPDSAEARANLGAVLIELGRTVQAARLLEAGVYKHPRSALMHNNLGIAYAQLGRTRDAIREFEAALRIAPDYESARRNLATATGEE